MSPQQKCNQNWNVTKTAISLKTKYQQNLNVTKHQNWNVTKTKVSTQQKHHQNWNVSKT